ncbi:MULTISPECIES: hypothetical protein [unclassified Nonomuraea]|uniref:hypothetical protein n=1 Tax=unclassified Nonomuraea TaxID=2593643 RepID=UPI003405A0F5
MTERGSPRSVLTALPARYARHSGRPAAVTGDVEQATGRPPRPFAEWVADRAEGFTRGAEADAHG